MEISDKVQSKSNENCEHAGLSPTEEKINGGIKNYCMITRTYCNTPKNKGTCRTYNNLLAESVGMMDYNIGW